MVDSYLWSSDKKGQQNIRALTVETYKKTYTLAELLIVVVIVGIAAMIGIPQYFKVLEKNQNKQARALIKMILEAEKMNRLKTGKFAPCANSEECNQVLKLSLPQDKWDYSVVVDAPEDSSVTGTIKAQRLPDKRVFELTLTASTMPEEVPKCSMDDGYCEGS